MSSNSLRVLMADDHPINRLIFQEMFRGLGCTVEAVDSGEMALQRASSAGFDLICLDRHMPGLSGDAVAARLRDDQLVVAWSTDLIALPTRFDTILTKPLTAESAIQVIALARAWREETRGSARVGRTAGRAAAPRGPGAGLRA